MALFAISLSSRGGAVFSTTPVQDVCTAAFFVAGLVLLAVAAYLLRRAPEGSF